MINNVEFHITDACTNHCPYCYIDAKRNKGQATYADFDTLGKIINEFEKSGVICVSLLGGDPVRHPRFLDIIKMIRVHNLEVTVMSNTMNVPGIQPKDLAQYINSIDTTIYGRNAEEHDQFCETIGAYNMLTRNLALYSKLGVPVNIAINIIPETFDKVYDIVTEIISHDINIDYLLTQRILSFGRAENSTRWNVNADQVNTAFEQAVRCEKEYGVKVRVEDPYPQCCINEKYHKYMHGCPEGVTRFAVDMNGYVSRCGADPHYSKLNLLETPLPEIWQNSYLFDSFREHQYLLEECKKCKLVYTCGGGCPIICDTYNLLGLNYIKEFRQPSK